VTELIPSAYLSMRRGLITFALVWQGAWLLADPNLWPTGVDEPVENILLGCTWASWVLILVLMLKSRAPKRISTLLEISIGLNLFLLVCSATAMAVHATGPGVNEWFLAASLFNLAVGTAGIMVRNPMQWLAVAAILVFEVFVFVILGIFNQGDVAVNSTILYPLYAFSMGVAAASVQRMLIRRAISLDDMQQESLLQAVSVKTADEVDSHIASVKRQIHESVLNTLTAISRGSLRDSQESRRLVQERCSESAQILSDLTHPLVLGPEKQVEGLIVPLQDLLVECAVRGIEVRIIGNVDAMPPGHVGREMIAASREVIINALRHSELTELTVRISSGRDLCIEISDNGVGFDPQTVLPGFGLTSLLRSNHGVRVTIDSPTLHGSTIRISATQRRNGVKVMGVGQANNTFPLVLPTLSAWLVFSAFSVFLTWSQFNLPIYNIVALFLYAVVAALAIGQSRKGALKPVMILVGSLSALVIYNLTELSGAMLGTPWTDWSSEAIGVLFLAMAAAGPWWAWIVVGSSWIIIQGNFPLEFIAPGFLLIMAGAFLGMQLRRTNRIRVGALERSTADAVRVALAEILTSSKIEKDLGVVPRSVIDLLVGISQGSLDPWTEAVQSECALLESHLRRTIFSPQSKPEPIAILSRDLSQRALSLGILLDLSLDEGFFHDSVHHEISEYLQQLMQELPQKSTARFSAASEGDRGVLRFVAHASGGLNGTDFEKLCEMAPWGKSIILTNENGQCELLWEGTLD
jgi:signal transduction histidine kinase